MEVECCCYSENVEIYKVLSPSTESFHELEVEESPNSPHELQEDWKFYEDVSPYSKSAEEKPNKPKPEIESEAERLLLCYESESDVFGCVVPCELSDPWRTPQSNSHHTNTHLGTFRPLSDVNRTNDVGISYASDIYVHKRQREVDMHVMDCLVIQPQVSAGMRAVLIDWLTRLHDQFQFYQETLFLTVNIIDRFLVTTSISSDCFQLLGITALLIAGKHEEIYPPAISELLRLSCHAYTRDQVRQLELIILGKISFRLLAPTAHFFLEYYTSSRIADVHHLHCTVSQIRQSRALAMYILEKGLQDYGLCQFLPSTLALSSLKVADQTLGQDTSPHYMHFTQSREENISLCAEDLRMLTSGSWECMDDVMAICEKYLDKS